MARYGTLGDYRFSDTQEAASTFAARMSMDPKIKSWARSPTSFRRSDRSGHICGRRTPADGSRARDL